MFQNQNTGGNGGVLGAGGNNAMDPAQQQAMNYNGLQHQQAQQHGAQQQLHQLHQQQDTKNVKSARQKPYVKITEQPAGKALRFRYECEGRSAGSIPGVNSTPENRTYPTIEIVGYKGRAVVVVSCVTKDKPYRPHPHNLVGKEGCKKGVCTLEINSETMRAVFSNLGIQCVKKKDIEAALKAREDIRVDPFKTGFSHRCQPSSIDLNSVRLCFQVFMESGQKGKFTEPLPPVVSDPIFDKKAMSDLVICRLCSCSASVLGNTQIILLCEKVAKEDIAVRFFEENNGQVVWEAYGEFQHTDVHKQTAITFKTPRYHTLDITEPAKVFIQLKRPSDGVTSEKLPFEYKPLDSDPANLRRKRQKTNGDPKHLLLQHQNDHTDGRQLSFATWNAPPIKTEPRDTSPQPFSQYRAQPELTPSPQPLSPSNNYNHPNAPSPYNLATTGGGHGNPLLISPNHHPNYGGGGGGSGGGGGGAMAAAVAASATNVNATGPALMDLQDYANYGQQHHQQQQQQQQTHHAAHNTHQQYHGNLFGSAGATQWESKCEVAALVNNTANNNNNNNNNNNTNQNTNMSNLTSNNPFTMHNLLNSSTNAQTIASNAPAHTQWNLMTQHHMHATALAPDPATQQQQHQHYHQQQVMNNDHNVTTNNIGAAGSNHNSNNQNQNNPNENGPTISTLLNLHSDQLVRINSEDLRLNSEDLQISNLSISS